MGFVSLGLRKRGTISKNIGERALFFNQGGNSVIFAFFNKNSIENDVFNEATKILIF